MRGFIFAAKIGKSNVINARNWEEYGKELMRDPGGKRRRFNR
jgi:hypothetical protein